MLKANRGKVESTPKAPRRAVKALSTSLSLVVGRGETLFRAKTLIHKNPSG